MANKKIVCSSCGTEFLFEAAKDFECCPVCGVLFDGEVNEAQDEGLMYFDEIMRFDKEPERSGVCVFCKECKDIRFLNLSLFDKLVDKQYVILKPDVVVKCRGCGKEHTPRKILYKRKDHYVSILHYCPVCNSTMVKKISTASRFFMAATLGSFAIPYNSKTYECQNCGHIF
ncbi:MAG: hypothetical protein HFI76_15200 [Lachnospiraceae bacterium]|nr:hypothetical protein [Lachnospiraceae bacterium]